MVTQPFVRPFTIPALRRRDLLVRRYPPALWFSPGAGTAALFANSQGELWLTTGGAPRRVWLTPLTHEFITCIWWSNLDGNLYLATYREEPVGTFTNRIYRVQPRAGTVTEVVSWAGGLGLNPVVDGAQHGSFVYLHCGGAFGGGQVRRFDPVAGTQAVVFNHPVASLNGGIAVDPLRGDLLDLGGNEVYRSPTGNVGSWVLDANLAALFGSFDSMSMVTHRGGDDLVYAGNQNAAGDILLRRPGLAQWLVDLAGGAFPDDSIVSLTPEYQGTVGTALYGQGWNTFGGATPRIRRKPVGGAWAIDWPGPGATWQGVYAQGLQQFQGSLYALFTQITIFPTQADMRLYRRDGAGQFTMMREWLAYWQNGLTNVQCGPMATSPNPLRLPHEV